MNHEQHQAQRRVDELSSEINDLYQQIREKESEREKMDRIANPADYENLCAGGIPNCPGGRDCTSDHK